MVVIKEVFSDIVVLLFLRLATNKHNKKCFFWQFSQSVSFNCLEKRSSNDLSPENNYYFKHSLRARGNIVIVFSVNFCRSYKSLLKFRVLDFVMPYEVERSSF